MAEADDQPKLCPCGGFWGSPSTKNLCSKCYKEHLKKLKPSAATSGATGSGSVGPVATSGSTAGMLLNDLLGGMPSTSSTPTSQEDSDSREEQANAIREEAGVAKMSDPVASFLPDDKPIQKNRRRCWSCKAKLELAQRELGLCKCGYVFCLMHRLPEQHNCLFNHKDSGRQEAMKNMVPVGRKKIGRSFHRLDSKPE